MNWKRALYRKVAVHHCPARLHWKVVQLVHAVLFLERISPDVQLDIFFLSLDDMQQVHYNSTGKNRPTDALTFREHNSTTLANAILFDDPICDVFTHCRREECRDVKSIAAKEFEVSRSSLQYFGEIYICPEYMKWRCIQYPFQSLPLGLYMQAAIVHALLHVLGFTHETPRELQAMVRKEQKLGLLLRMLQRRHPCLLSPIVDIDFSFSCSQQ